MQKRRKAHGCDLTGHLRDTDGTAELIGRLPAGNDAGDVAERTLDHKPRFADAHGERFTKAVALRDDVRRSCRAGDAEHTDAMHVAEVVFALLELRRGRERQTLAIAINLDLERRSGCRAHHALHVGEAFDLLSVDPDHEVAWLEAGN